MKRCRCALTVAALVLLSLVVAGPAAAGGPTSALLVMPETGVTASVYTSDEAYNELAKQVGAFEADTVSGRTDEHGSGHATGPSVTVTWLIHDVSVWRVDRIYVDAKGGPWISTQVSSFEEGASIFDSPLVWHTAAEGRSLQALLDRLGFDLVGQDAALPRDQAGSEVGGVPSTAPEQRSPLQGQPAASDSTGSGSLDLGVAALLLGAGLTLLMTHGLPAIRRRRTERAEAALDPAYDVERAPVWASELDDEMPTPTDTIASGARR